MQSNAPIRVASTASRMVPWPEIMTTAGRSAAGISWMRASVSRPSSPGRYGNLGAPGNPAGRATPLLIVFGCTVLGAAAQILFKFGLKAMPQFSPLAVLMNVQLMAGLALYGASTVLLVLALRQGELSLIYPVILAIVTITAT